MGLICSQNIDKAATALIKLALGSSDLAKRVNVDEYLKQYDELSDDMKRIDLNQDDENTHPYTAIRVKRLLKWVKSKKYKSIYRPENLQKKEVYRCPSCNNEVKVDFTSCPYCGANFYECEFCHAPALEESTKCLVCGVEFE